jgi:hypothetical protein
MPGNVLHEEVTHLDPVAKESVLTDRLTKAEQDSTILVQEPERTPLGIIEEQVRRAAARSQPIDGEGDRVTFELEDDRRGRDKQAGKLKQI